MLKIVLLLTISIVGCSSQKLYERKDPKRFPTQDEIQKLAEKKVERTTLDLRKPGKVVDNWTLTGPLPTKIGSIPVEAKTPIEKAIESRIQNNPMLRLSSAMRCSSRELGLFHIQHGRLPHQSLENFIYGRCGTPGSGELQWMSLPNFDINDPKNIDTIILAFDSFFTKERKKTTYFGVYLHHDKDKTQLFLSVQYDSFTLIPVDIHTTDGVFVFEGEATGFPDTTRFHAAANIGSFDAIECERQELPSPKFKFLCRLDPKDDFRYISVSSCLADAVYCNEGVSFAAISKTSATYTAPSIRRILTLSRKEKKVFSSRKEELLYFEKIINQVRNSAGRKSLVLELEQTKEIQSLTRKYFDIGDNKESVTQKNKVILAMLAGWKVKTDIVDTSFRTNYSETLDPARIIESYLEKPGGRKTLLSPDASSFALGQLSDPKRGSTSIIISYDYLPKEHMNKRIRRFITSLNKQRKSRGNSPAKEIKGFRLDALEWEKEFQEGASFESIREKMWSAYNYQYGWKRTRGQFYSTSSLDDFSESLQNKKDLKLFVMVTPYKAKNAPRYFYAIFVIWDNSK